MYTITSSELINNYANKIYCFLHGLQIRKIYYLCRLSHPYWIIFRKLPVLFKSYVGHDHQKFSKKLTGMGFGKVSEKMELIQAEEQRKKLTRKIDIDELSERIAIVRSNEYEGVEMLMLIEEIKKDLEYGVVDTSEEKYWKDLKEAGESLI